MSEDLINKLKSTYPELQLYKQDLILPCKDIQTGRLFPLIQISDGSGKLRLSYMAPREDTNYNIEGAMLMYFMYINYESEIFEKLDDIYTELTHIAKLYNQSDYSAESDQLKSLGFLYCDREYSTSHWKMVSNDVDISIYIGSVNDTFLYPYHCSVRKPNGVVLSYINRWRLDEVLDAVAEGVKEGV